MGDDYRDNFKYCIFLINANFHGKEFSGVTLKHNKASTS
jgi:hypothetical protein